ncbi:MAG: DUF4419 domain-containing protein [Candidatus Xenobia bacterium]
MSTAVISFPVDEVERTDGTAEQVSLQDALAWLPAKVAYSATHPALRPHPPLGPIDIFHGQPTDPYHGLATTVHAAWAEHRPLVLTPDAVWLTILQGFGAHVRENAEALRDRFVTHQDKVEISLRRDAPQWDEVVGALSLRISEYLKGDLHALATAPFSTTGPLEAACHNAALLYSMQDYFSYTVYTMCGIPSVRLEGTVADWQALRDRAARLAPYDLEWWIEHLVPVLDQFVKAAQGRPERDFWQRIYYYDAGHGSGGGPTITGWLTTFFPYLDGMSNRLRRSRLPGASLPTQAIPPATVRTPFVWNVLGDQHRMQFVTGLLGAAGDPDGAVRPVLGWAVARCQADAPG